MPQSMSLLQDLLFLLAATPIVLVIAFLGIMAINWIDHYRAWGEIAAGAFVVWLVSGIAYFVWLRA